VQALEDVLTLYARRLEQRAVKVQTEFRARPVVRAFGGELRQIFSNVVNNAADAMPAGGAMRVRVSDVRRAGMPHVRISFADRGTGIGAQQISHIFEPFFTTKRDVGTGLGLWVTKELVEKHGGWITVRSTTDAARHGTVFSIILPQEVIEERATA
jgi:signal transduction histidine kinase